MAKLTMFEKIWQKHLVAEPKDQPVILYIDLHLVHEVTSPQAFEGLRISNRKAVSYTHLTLPTSDLV